MYFPNERSDDFERNKSGLYARTRTDAPAPFVTKAAAIRARERRGWFSFYATLVVSRAAPARKKKKKLIQLI